MSLLNILSSPDAWTKHASARNAEDVIVQLDNPNAVKFCLTGALRHYQRDFDIKTNLWDNIKGIILNRFPERLDAFAGELESAITDFNDHPDTTFEEVVSVVQEAEALIFRRS